MLAIALKRTHLELALLAQIATDEARYTVSLPFGCRHNLLDSGALGPSEQLQDSSRLAVGARRRFQCALAGFPRGTWRLRFTRLQRAPQAAGADRAIFKAAYR